MWEESKQWEKDGDCRICSKKINCKTRCKPKLKKKIKPLKEDTFYGRIKESIFNREDEEDET